MSRPAGQPPARVTGIEILAVILALAVAWATIARAHHLATIAAAPARTAAVAHTSLISSPATQPSLDPGPFSTQPGTLQTFEQSVASAQEHARDAAADIARCASVSGQLAACTSPTTDSLGQSTGLLIVDRVPGPGEVQVIAKRRSYRVIAGAQRGFTYAIDVDAKTGQTSRTCRNRHDRHACSPPTW